MQQAALSTKLQPAAKSVATAKPEITSPLIAVVSIGDQRVTIWSGDTTVARAPVSTGMAGHRTPTGVFSVIGKERYHESNLYSNAPMPYMQRITWSGVAMHEGALPGYPASHGCIRLPGDFAQRLFGMTRMGMRVIVSDRDLAPVSFAHMALPAPTFVREQQLVNAGLTVPAAPAGRMQLGAPAEGSGRLLNPVERGRIEQGRAKSLALDAQAEAQALLDIAATRGAEARAAAEEVRAAEAALLAITLGREKAIEAAQNAGLSDADRAKAVTSRDALETAYRVAMDRVAGARAELRHSDAGAFHAAGEAKVAVAERDALAQAARVADRATEPVSVFVSRKERRVFVRQGFEQVFEADIDIADPQTPLGTHVFTAVAPPSEGGSMKWVALTVQGAALAEEPKPRAAKTAQPAERPRTAYAPVSAASALDRIKFSDDVLQKISEKLWTGASLIISDYGISNETGKGTDFVVLTK